MIRNNIKSNKRQLTNYLPYILEFVKRSIHYFNEPLLYD